MSAHSGSPQIIHKNKGSGPWVGLVITHTSHGINTDENGHNNYLHNVYKRIGTVVPRLFKPWIIRNLDYLNSLEATLYYE